MTREAFLKALIERDWTPSVSGRSTDVPDPDATPPRITWTLDRSQREARLQTRDVGYVTTATDTTYTPFDLGWRNEQVEGSVVIEYRTARRSNTAAGVYDDPYERLHGKRTGTDGVGAPDDWDGIVGETERVILDNRKGEGEYRRVGNDSTGQGIVVRDLADLGGVNYYRADVVVPLEAIREVAIATATGSLGTFSLGEQRLGEA